MKHSLRSAALALPLLLAGCVVAPIGGPYAEADVVMSSPPPPRVEVVPVAPAYGWIWITGNWAWYGGHYRWQPGYWAPPRPGYGWAPGRWYRSGPGWRNAPGRWERR